MSEKYCPTYRPFVVALGRILTALLPDLTLLDVALRTWLAPPVSMLEGFVDPLETESGWRGESKFTLQLLKRASN
jgi:hypothetical protein